MPTVSTERARAMRGPRSAAARLRCPECGRAMEGVFQQAHDGGFTRVPNLFYCATDGEFARRTASGAVPA